MNKAVLKRLESLEQKALPDNRPVHVLFGDAKALIRQEQELKASPKWAEGDEMMLIELVLGRTGEERAGSENLNGGISGVSA